MNDVHLHDPHTLREGADWDALGASAQEIREFALGGLNRRLSIIGASLS